ncbi:MAG TPA: hypothetical protein VGL86_13190 [Polyangia bacterium]|jgi:hypothetical protein
MDIIREAGFPVWFVLALGSWSLVQAVRYRIASGSAGELIGAVAATILCGVLATAWGAQLSFAGIRELPDPAQQGWIAWIGVKESLYNLDLASGFGIAAALVATVGRRRDAVASTG